MWDSNFWDKTWARKYERYTRHHQQIWEKILPYLGGEVCDIGCGAAVMYENKDISLTGVDWSEEGIKQAKLHYPKGKYFVADCRNTGLPSEKFDTVIMSGLLDYFDDWSDAIKEAKRVAKPSGKIVATLLDTFQGHDWSKREYVEKKYPIKSYERVCGNWILIEIQ